MAKAKNKFEWASLPIINYINVMEGDGPEVLMDWLKRASLAHSEEGGVNFHQDRLGKQKMCWTGSNRFWVWEGKDWRIFASNKVGTSIEVKAGLTTDQAWDAFNDYLTAIGLQ